MVKQAISVVAAVAALAGLVAQARADLKSFLAKPEPAYKWEKRDQKSLSNGTFYDLHLVSQTWQGRPWEHRLMVFKPAHLEHPEFCSLLNTGGNGSNGDIALGMQVANGTGCMAAILFNIPNQPLYDKTEDALVVYTWQKYLETGDDSWPLHFPMAKSVIKAMDAIQEFAKSESLPAVDSFMVYGASKRGWTTWLVGASRDPRVKAIAPMVIDTLNVAAQIPHQLQAYGKASEQVADYTNAGMLTALNSPQGRKLMELEDPYSYRDILTLPKLLVLGTNDQYWAQDALNIYWDGLKGPKWVSYTPNSGHGLENKVHVFATATAFIRMVAEHGKWPKLHWSYTPTADGGQQIHVTSDTPIVSARLFHNSAATQDFRDTLSWAADPIEVKGNEATGTMAPPASGYTAIFGEVTFEQDGKPYTLSTQISILSAKK